jgi:hypothetical protein
MPGSTPLTSTDMLPLTLCLPPADPACRSFFVQWKVSPFNSLKSLTKEIDVCPPFRLTFTDNLNRRPAPVGRRFVCEVRLELAVDLPIVVSEVTVANARSVEVEICEAAFPLALETGEAFALVVLLLPLHPDVVLLSRAALALWYTAEPWFHGTFEWQFDLPRYSTTPGTVDVALDVPAWCSVGTEGAFRVTVRGIAAGPQQLRVEIAEDRAAFIVHGFVRRTMEVCAGKAAICDFRFIPLEAGEHRLPEIMVFSGGAKVWSSAPLLFVM